jgi:hypothetical protein
MRHKIFQTIEHKHFTKSYITLEERDNRQIQILVRSGKVYYRLLNSGNVVRKEVREWKNRDITPFQFSCLNYCSDCGCNKW